MLLKAAMAAHSNVESLGHVTGADVLLTRNC